MEMHCVLCKVGTLVFTYCLHKFSANRCVRNIFSHVNVKNTDMFLERGFYVT